MKQQVNLSEVELSNFNPRYNEVMHSDGFDKIREENKKYNEIETAKKLLGYETFAPDEFIELTKSLSEKFNKNIDKPFFIEFDNKYIVVEGNRRILSMKLLNSLIPAKDLFDGNTLEKMEAIIKEYSDKKIQFEIDDYELIDDEESLWPAIYTRHVSEAKGKRPWSRLKYFYDVINFIDSKEMKDVDKNNKFEYASARFNRKTSTLKNDYKSGVFVKSLITEYNNVEEIKIDPFSEDSNSKKGIKPSALEPNNIGNIKVGDVSLFEYVGIDISGNPPFLINKEKSRAKGNFSFKELAHFIIESYLKKMFTTRGWKASSRYVLLNFVNNTGLEGLDEKTSKTLPELFPIEKREVDDISQNINSFEKDQKQQKEVSEPASSIVDSLKEVANSLNELETPNKNPHIETIRIIYNFLSSIDLDLPQISELPFAAISVSIRTIWEHIIYFILENTKETHNFFKGKTKNLKEKIYTYESSSILRSMTGYAKTNDKIKIKNQRIELESFVDVLMDSKKMTSSHKVILEVLTKNQIIFQNEGWFNPINEMVHCMAKIIKDETQYNAVMFIKIQIETLSVIIKKIVT